MPNLATYHALQDSPIQLDLLGHKESFVNFNPPNDIILAEAGVNRPVLSFRVDPSNDAKNLRFKALIRQSNGTDEVVSDYILNGTISRTVFEIVRGSQLHKGDQRIIFRLQNGIGSAKISDVIFWFMRSI